MKSFKRALTAWVPIWLLLMIAAWLLSDGEPICNGPLILAVAESNPPQCDSPVDGLLQVGLSLFVAGLIPITIGVAGVVMWRKLRGETNL